jgi:hypothetical protein
MTGAGQVASLIQGLGLEIDSSLPARPLFSSIMKNIALLTSAVLLALTSCASPLQRRLEKNPDLLAKLSASQKASVLAGRVEEGMTKEAVFLAWGRPSRVTGGKREGKTFERWNYTGYEPVYRQPMGFGMGLGYDGIGYNGIGIGRSRHVHGRYARDYYDPFYYQMSPQVDYVPFDAKMVEFTGGKVTAFAVPK